MEAGTQIRHTEIAITPPRGLFHFAKLWCRVRSRHSLCTTNVQGQRVKGQSHSV